MSTRVPLTIFPVDICITTDWKEMEGVCIIAELLAKSEPNIARPSIMLTKYQMGWRELYAYLLRRFPLLRYGIQSYALHAI
jgi:hypothetical protein